MRGIAVCPTFAKAKLSVRSDRLKFLALWIEAANPYCAHARLVYNEDAGVTGFGCKPSRVKPPKHKADDDDNNNEEHEVPTYIKDLSNGGHELLKFQYIGNTSLEYLKVAMRQVQDVFTSLQNKELLVTDWNVDDMRRCLLDEIRQTLDDNRLGFLLKYCDLIEDGNVKELCLALTGSDRLDGNGKRLVAPNYGATITDSMIDVILKEYMANSIFADEVTARCSQLTSVLTDVTSAAKRLRNRFEKGYFKLKSKGRGRRSTPLRRTRRKFKKRTLAKIKEHDENYVKALQRIKRKQTVTIILTTAYYKGLSSFYFKCLGGTTDRSRNSFGRRDFPKLSAQMVLLHVAKGIFETFSSAFSETFITKLDSLFNIRMLSDIQKYCLPDEKDSKKIRSFPALEVYNDLKQLKRLIPTWKETANTDKKVAKAIAEFEKVDDNEKEAYLQKCDPRLAVVNGEICLVNGVVKPETLKDVCSRRTRGVERDRDWYKDDDDDDNDDDSDFSSISSDWSRDSNSSDWSWDSNSGRSLL